MEKVNFFKVSELKVKKVLEDSTLRVVANKNTMVSFFEFGPKTPFMPNHKHPHEQTAFVVAGSVKMIAGGETKVLKVNEGAVIPSNVEHEVYPLEPGTKIMDVFYPIREDYL
ncbi:MAG: cupin domain-containing protein [Candidatus Atribacteria bacterium]|nr:cupin domain-containing protein [Candidatus Atribacteria bacterium]